jgi:uncharacterized membrane protein YjjP (DUF1212 family)
MWRWFSAAIKFGLGVLWLIIGASMLWAGVSATPRDTATMVVGGVLLVVAGLFFWWGVRVVQKGSRVDGEVRA